MNGISIHRWRLIGMSKINLFLLILMLNISIFSFTPEFHFVPDDVIHKAIGNDIMQNLNALAKIGDMPEGLKISSWMRTPVYDRNGNVIFYEEVGYFGKEPLPENAYEIVMGKIKELIRDNYKKYKWDMEFNSSEIGKFLEVSVFFAKDKWYNDKNFCSYLISPYYEGYPMQFNEAGFGIRSLWEYALCEYYLYSIYGDTKTWKPSKLIFQEWCGYDKYKWVYEIDGKEYVMMMSKYLTPEGCYIEPLETAEVGTREEYYFEQGPRANKMTIEEFINYNKLWWDKYESGELWEKNDSGYLIKDIPKKTVVVYMNRKDLVPDWETLSWDMPEVRYSCCVVRTIANILSYDTAIENFNFTKDDNKDEPDDKDDWQWNFSGNNKDEEYNNQLQYWMSYFCWVKLDKNWTKENWGLMLFETAEMTYRFMGYNGFTYQHNKQFYGGIAQETCPPFQNIYYAITGDNNGFGKPVFLAYPLNYPPGEDWHSVTVVGFEQISDSNRRVYYYDNTGYSAIWKIWWEDDQGYKNNRDWAPYKILILDKDGQFDNNYKGEGQRNEPPLFVKSVKYEKEGINIDWKGSNYCVGYNIYLCPPEWNKTYVYNRIKNYSKIINADLIPYNKNGSNFFIPYYMLNNKSNRIFIEGKININGERSDYLSEPIELEVR